MRRVCRSKFSISNVDSHHRSTMKTLSLAFAQTTTQPALNKHFIRKVKHKDCRGVWEECVVSRESSLDRHHPSNWSEEGKKSVSNCCDLLLALMILFTLACASTNMHTHLHIHTRKVTTVMTGYTMCEENERCENISPLCFFAADNKSFQSSRLLHTKKKTVSYTNMCVSISLSVSDPGWKWGGRKRGAWNFSSFFISRILISIMRCSPSAKEAERIGWKEKKSTNSSFLCGQFYSNSSCIFFL